MTLPGASATPTQDNAMPWSQPPPHCACAGNPLRLHILCCKMAPYPRKGEAKMESLMHDNLRTRTGGRFAPNGIGASSALRPVIMHR